MRDFLPAILGYAAGGATLGLWLAVVVVALLSGCNHCAYLYDGGKVDGINRPYYLACDVDGKAKVMCDDVRKLPTANCNESHAPK